MNRNAASLPAATSLVMAWTACLVLTAEVCPQALGAARPETRDSDLAVQGRPFEGFTALVAEPENSWTWDSAIFGALEERGFEVTYGRAPADVGALRRYDLVALSIKRNLTAAEDDAVRKYVAEGGAVYGSWGGPFGSAGLMREVCRVGSFRSVRLTRMVLAKGPLARGISEHRIEFAARAGHVTAGPAGWEVVIVEPLPGGIPVATDAAGGVLGVLSRYGKGRAATLGFGPEQDKHLAESALGPVMLDNLLGWLLEGKLGRQPGRLTGRIAVALPARAEVLDVSVDGQRVARPATKEVGSLKKIELELGGLGPDKQAVVRIAYKPLAEARHVETWVHLPWNTLRAAAKSPGQLADYLKSLNATACQPLLRGAHGEAWYRGMPDDLPDDKLVKQYRGDFLADLIAECHRRGIRLIAGLYFDNAAPLRRHPDVRRVDRRGNELKDPYGRGLACFNNPKAREHNLATVRHLVGQYKVDGIILDDNFELDKNDCYCPYCKEAFRKYCEARGLAYRDPAGISDAAMASHWRLHRREATRRLAAEVTAIAREAHLPAGGWVGAGMDAVHLGGAFDFLGGMVYSSPPRSARGPLSVLGGCRYVCLLWAPQSSPAAMEREVRQAVHAGCAAVGFWVRGADGGYQMDADRTAAIRRAFAGTEKQWLAFYLSNLLTGDKRFVVVDGKVGREELRLRIRNAGQGPPSRISGHVDLSALE
jgi:hypothetical protein